MPNSPTKTSHNYDLLRLSYAFLRSIKSSPRLLLPTLAYCMQTWRTRARSSTVCPGLNPVCVGALRWASSARVCSLWLTMPMANLASRWPTAIPLELLGSPLSPFYLKRGTNLRSRHDLGGVPLAIHKLKNLASGVRASPAKCLTTWEGSGHIPLDAAPLNFVKHTAISAASTSSNPGTGRGGTASGGAVGSKNSERIWSAIAGGGTPGGHCYDECAYE